MRRVLIFVPLILLCGCRPPAIPPSPSSREYAVYHALLEDIADTAQPQDTLVVSAFTRPLNQAELQYQQCLPKRMRAVYDNLTPVALTPSPGVDWLNLSGRPATLILTPDLPPGDHPVLLLHLSRVAFTLSGYDAFLWVDQTRCTPDGANPRCDGTQGRLIHGHRSDGIWTFAETICATSTPAPWAPLP